MFYKTIGWFVWNGGKLLLKQKYGRTYVPKPVLAGAVLAVAGLAAVLVTRHTSDD
jgi:hypothetical protein